ncbi:MAG: DUF4430 domain-containing protein [Bacilli bacterium]|jgi:hypothetical protein|nr:DUF4430 domain-containing protein [Bacilli bacterium]
MRKIKTLLLALIIMVGCIGCSIQSKEEFKNGTNPDIKINTTTKENDKDIAFTLTIDNHMINEDDNYDKLDKAIQEKYPKDKNLVEALPIVVTKEMSVKDVIDDFAKANDINIVYGDMSGMSYIISINGLGSKTLGASSGWLYTINGELPLTSIDKTMVKENDKISFVYTVDGGKDVGFSFE